MRGVEHLLLEFDVILKDTPMIWTDSTAAKQASQQLGPGRLMRHLESQHMFVQTLIHSKKLKCGMVERQHNYSDPLTKPVTKDVLQCHLSEIGWSTSAAPSCETTQGSLCPGRSPSRAAWA